MQTVTSSEDILAALTTGAVAAQPHVENGTKTAGFTSAKGRQLPALGDNPYANIKMVAFGRECPRCHLQIEARGFHNHVPGCDGNPRTVLEKRVFKLYRQLHPAERLEYYQAYDIEWDDDNNVIAVNVVSMTDARAKIKREKSADQKAEEKRAKDRERKRIAKEKEKEQEKQWVEKVAEIVNVANAPQGDLEALISMVEDHVKESNTVTFKQFNAWKQATTEIWLAS